MTGLYLKIIGGFVLVGLVIALGMSIKAHGEKDADIRHLRGKLTEASSALKQASRDIERFSQKEGAVAAEAARLCAAEGNTAFMRGVEVGTAICEARK